MTKLHTSRWSDKDIRLLQKVYGELDIDQIGQLLGKSHGAIRSKVHYLRKRGWAFNSTRR